jgi:hypothetical protein
MDHSSKKSKKTPSIDVEEYKREDGIGSSNERRKHAREVKFEKRASTALDKQRMSANSNYFGDPYPSIGNSRREQNKSYYP